MFLQEHPVCLLLPCKIAEVFLQDTPALSPPKPGATLHHRANVAEAGDGLRAVPNLRSVPVGTYWSIRCAS